MQSWCKEYIPNAKRISSLFCAILIEETVMFDKKITNESAAATLSAADAVDIHRNAYNAAFYELGLKWHWDGKIYPSVLCQDDERARLRAYLETHQSHLLKAYDAEFLVDAVQTAKARCFETMSEAGSRRGAPAAAINWAELHQHEVGV